MKYFLDGHDRKVALFNVNPTVKQGIVYGYDLFGRCHHLAAFEVLDDGEEEFVYTSVPIKFPKGFVPPEIFGEKRCVLCPFHITVDLKEKCCLLDEDEDPYCPIKKGFK